MYVVYILQSQKSGRYYVGCTSDITRRLKQHNNGSNKSTKSGCPWELVYKEILETKEAAWKREHQIKSYKGGKAFQKLVS